MILLKKLNITYTAVHKTTGHHRLVNMSVTQAIIYGHTFQTEDEEFFIYQCDKEKLNILLN